jgi:hypothetical protein
VEFRDLDLPHLSSFLAFFLSSVGICCFFAVSGSGLSGFFWSAFMEEIFSSSSSSSFPLK